MSALPAIRIRSDVERKRMFHLREKADSGSGVASGIYCESANRNLYRRMHDIGTKLLTAGHDVILDASYLKIAQRKHAREIAADCNAGFVIVQTLAPANTLCNRLRSRADAREDASEADSAVLDYQSEIYEALTPAEKQLTVSWSSPEMDDAKKFINRLRIAQGHPAGKVH
jgi:predicted kinase